MNHTDVLKLIDPFINAPVECDGFTRLAHSALANAGKRHRVMAGRLIAAGGGHQTPLHYWIELECGSVIDYRAQMWLGPTPDVPHGIFNVDDFPRWKYEGHEVEMPTLPPALAELIATPIPHQILTTKSIGEAG